MGSLVWGNPLVLWGLAALAVPIALHLMNRELPRRVVFPTIRFIYKGRELQQGRRSLRDILTLLARCALLAALVLLLADPRLAPEPQAAEAGGQEVLVFVDNSLSLSAVDYQTWLENSLDEILTNHPDAVVGLVVSGASLQQALPLGTDRAAIRAAVAAARPTKLPGRHEDAWRELGTMFSDRPQVDRYVYLLSDFQRSDWNGFQTMASTVPGTLRPMPPPDRPDQNLAVTDATPDLQSRGDSRRLRVTAQIQNYGLQPVTTTVELIAGERSVSREVELPGQGAAKVVLEMENPEGNRAEVRLPDDAYAWDNDWHIWIGPRPPITVAVIAGNPQRQTIDLFFLRKALATNLPGFERIEARFADRNFITEDNPHAYSRLILLDATFDLTDLEHDVLQEYLSHGGEIIIFGGQRFSESIASLNRTGLARSRFVGRQGLNTSAQTTSITRMQPGTDMLAVFEREPSDLFLFPIAKYARLDPAESAQTLLYLPDDQPFLLREPSGAGGIYIFAVSLNPDWSEFPTSLSFLPLLRRLIETGESDASGVIQAEVGEALAPRLERYGMVVPEVLPDAPGISIVDNRPIIINSTRAESDPDALTDLDWTAIRNRGKTSAAPATASIAPDQERSLRGALALAALLLIFLEIGLANWK